MPLIEGHPTIRLEKGQLGNIPDMASFHHTELSKFGMLSFKADPEEMITEEELGLNIVLDAENKQQVPFGVQKKKPVLSLTIFSIKQIMPFFYEILSRPEQAAEHKNIRKAKRIKLRDAFQAEFDKYKMDGFIDKEDLKADALRFFDFMLGKFRDLRTGRALELKYLILAQAIELQNMVKRMGYNPHEIKNDLLKEVFGEMDGITSAYTYIALNASPFVAHGEDCKLSNAMNVMLSKEGCKIWLTVMPEDNQKLFQSTFEYFKLHKMLNLLPDRDGNPYQHKTFFVDRRLLDDWNVRYSIFAQVHAEIVVVSSAAIHMGLNFGYSNVASSINFLSLDYFRNFNRIPYNWQCVCDEIEDGGVSLSKEKCAKLLEAYAERERGLDILRREWMRDRNDSKVRDLVMGVHQKSGDLLLKNDAVQELKSRALKRMQYIDELVKTFRDMPVEKILPSFYQIVCSKDEKNDHTFLEALGDLALELASEIPCRVDAWQLVDFFLKYRLDYGSSKLLQFLTGQFTLPDRQMISFIQASARCGRWEALLPFWIQSNETVKSTVLEFVARNPDAYGPLFVKMCLEGGRTELLLNGSKKITLQKDSILYSLNCLAKDLKETWKPVIEKLFKEYSLGEEAKKEILRQDPGYESLAVSAKDFRYVLQPAPKKSKSHGIKNEHTCLCKQTFRSKFKLERHIREKAVEEKEKFKCKEPGCKATFKRDTDYRSHLKRVHFENKKLLTCPNCMFATSYPGNLTRHLENEQCNKPKGRPKKDQSS